MKYKVMKLTNNIVDFFINIKKHIKQNKKTSIILSIILILIIISIMIIMFDKTENGNTSGNLNNSGFSVRKDGWVYYLGLKDNNTDGIYRMKLNSDKKEKISSDYGLYLNESGQFLYYLDLSEGQNNIIKTKRNGEDKETIIKNVDIAKIIVVDKWIYYFKESNLYRAKIDGEQKQILSKKEINNYEVIENWIYYSYVRDGKHVIEKMQTNGENITKLACDASQMFFIDNSNIYYIYENYNKDESEYNYQIYKIKTNGSSKEKIADIGKNVKLESINFDNDKIYYAKKNENDILAIYSIKTNGKDESKIIEIQGNSTLINIHDEWVYYTDTNESGDSQMFRVKTNGQDKQSI